MEGSKEVMITVVTFLQYNTCDAIVFEIYFAGGGDTAIVVWSKRKVCGCSYNSICGTIERRAPRSGADKIPVPSDGSDRDVWRRRHRHFRRNQEKVFTAGTRNVS